MWSAPAAVVSSLYVHVPFCAHKCEYCAFYSEPAGGDLINRFVAALGREMNQIAGQVRPQTIYFGGGTPSLLNLTQWRQVLASMARLDWLNPAEWTVECNPATVSLDKARLWRDHGVNRISLGVQSLDEGLLDRLGRVHSRDMVFKTYALLRQAGFDNIGLDLMFAIPGQTLDVWQATLDQALDLEPEHLSSYEVIYEEDTPLYAQLQANEFSVDEDLACAMYDALLERADGRGFAQYEIANFARRQPLGDRPAPPPPGEPAPAVPASAVPARACRHNVNYWRGGAYCGLGPSAASYVDGVRTKNWPNTPLYCEQLEQDRRPLESRDELPPLERAGEIAAFGLRMTDGWAFDEFAQVTGFDLRQEWAAELAELADSGWGVLEPGRFRLTRQGLRFADAVAEMFLRLPPPAAPARLT